MSAAEGIAPVVRGVMLDRRPLVHRGLVTSLALEEGSARTTLVAARCARSPDQENRWVGEAPRRVLDGSASFARGASLRDDLCNNTARAVDQYLWGRPDLADVNA